MNNFNPNNIDREKILERKYFHQLPRKTPADALGIHLEVKGAFCVAQLGLGNDHQVFFDGGTLDHIGKETIPVVGRFQVRVDVTVAAGDMGVFFFGAGHTFCIVGMLFFPAEGFAGNTDTGKLQTPENCQYYHKGKAGDDLPKAAPVFSASIQLFPKAFFVLWQDHTSFPLVSGVIL